MAINSFDPLIDMATLYSKIEHPSDQSEQLYDEPGDVYEEQLDVTDTSSEGQLYVCTTTKCF